MPHGRWALEWTKRTRLLAAVGLAGVVEFVAAVLALHAASVPNEPWHMSEFANTRFGALWALAVLGFAVGGLALTLALRPTMPDSGWQRAGLGMFWLASVGALLMVVFPVDADADNPTLPGMIHEEVGPPTFVLAGAAMVVLAPAFRSDAAWRPFAFASLTLGLLVTASALAYVAYTAQGLAMSAVAQRVMVGLICTWFILVGTRILRSKAGPILPDPSAGAATPATPGQEPAPHPAVERGRTLTRPASRPGQRPSAVPLPRATVVLQRPPARADQAPRVCRTPKPKMAAKRSRPARRPRPTA